MINVIFIPPVPRTRISSKCDKLTFSSSATVSKNNLLYYNHSRYK